MKHLEGTFKGVRDFDLYYQCWLPDEECRAVLLVVHGLAEHSGRYMNLVNHFVPLGYGVYGIDHLGHGKSGGRRVFVERFDDFIKPLKEYLARVREWQFGKPIFMVGHSLGALIAAVYLLDHRADVAGAVLSGPPVKIPDNVSPAIVFIGQLLSTLMPKFGLIGLRAEGVCRDPEVVQAYLNDPLVYTGKTTARLAAEMLKAMKRVQSEAKALKLPLLIIQGGADSLVDPGGAPLLYEWATSTNKKIILYEGCYHEVFNEPERAQVFQDVESWLERILSSSIQQN